MKKEFHLGDILSITTGRIFSTSGMGGIYAILNFMTGEKLFTNQLPRTSDTCKPSLFKQFPHLEELDTSEVNKDNYQDFLNKQIEQFGEFHEVSHLDEDIYEHKDPILEAEEMMAK